MTVLRRTNGDVNRDINPVDDGSKVMKLDATTQNDRWLKGPELLRREESEWPRSIKVRVFEDDDPAVRKELRIYATAESRDIMREIIEYYSSWRKLKLSVAWLIRYKRYLMSKVAQSKHSTSGVAEKVNMTGFLKVGELKEAENEILKYVQRKEFPDMMNMRFSSVKGGDRAYVRLIKKAGVSVSKLHPVVVDGLLRVGGRIGKAPLSFEKNHPVILPNKSVITSLISVSAGSSKEELQFVAS